MALSYREVADILKIIDASQCEEVVLELGDSRLVVRRGTASTGAPAPQQTAARGAAASDAGAAPRASAPAASAASSDAGAGPAAGADGGVMVRAPMVGTFYRRPSPEEDPFVEEGARVEKGAPLGLIEVMKLYTTIEAPTDGVVETIAADDGALVEFNQPLFVIRPA